MFILYDFINLVFILFYLPVFIFRRKMHVGFAMRLGFLPKDVYFNNPIWIHSVSVGETASIKQLVLELRKNFPDKKFVFSTVTATGNKIAKTLAGKNDFVTYLPLDLSFIVNRVLNKIKPSMFIIAETEFWPNMLYALTERKIPIVIVNGRISDKSFKGYYKVRFLLKPLLNKVSLFCTQTQLDAQRLLKIGVNSEIVKVTGNMKFDVKVSQFNQNIVNEYKNKLGILNSHKVFVAGSTHSTEEAILLQAYKKLLKSYPELKLIFVPRHPERSDEVKKLVDDYGFKAVKISTFVNKNRKLEEKEIFILDTVGQLMNYYAIADVVFVGGSLVKTGGHNILEPAGLGKPVIFGPHMFNFKDICELFLENKAGIQIHNQEELVINIKMLLKDSQKRQNLCVTALKLLEINQGATLKNLELIKTLI